jgi:hypothetical protein
LLPPSPFLARLQAISTSTPEDQLGPLVIKPIFGGAETTLDVPKKGLTKPNPPAASKPTINSDKQ